MDEEKLRKIADKLVTTLGGMSSEEADKTVINCAYMIYTDILGLKGTVKKTLNATAKWGVDVLI
jgi:hypothetical protein